MCDYSLESYQSRPAREGEEYVSSRFPSNSVGFISPGDPTVAVCMACDTRLKLSHISECVQVMARVGEAEEVTFLQVDGAIHRDSVRFNNGSVLSLQLLGPGVTAWLVPESCLSSSPVEGQPETALG
jgi:hypothetical protein